MKLGNTGYVKTSAT